jgi:hypothetical protein
MAVFLAGAGVADVFGAELVGGGVGSLAGAEAGLFLDRSNIAIVLVS